MKEPVRIDFALMVLRVGIGFLAAYQHGLPKLLSFSERASTFPDPIGVSPTVTLTIVIFSELVCGIALIFGFLTRLAAAPLAFSMFIAAFLVHSTDPVAQRELALLYFVPVTTILFAGPGKFSIDFALEKSVAKEKLK